MKQQYLTNKQYLIEYIGTLLRKKHVINKEFLRVIQQDLINKGCIEETTKYKFLYGFLKKDRKHKDININEILYSLETYITQENNKQSTLENYFI